MGTGPQWEGLCLGDWIGRLDVHSVIHSYKAGGLQGWLGEHPLPISPSLACQEHPDRLTAANC